MDDTFEEFPPRRQRPRGMGATLDQVLAAVNGQPFSYEYDFGSTTELKIRRLGERIGKQGSRPLRLLARNEAPQWPCAVCGETADLLCPECMYEADPFLCEEHAQGHGCRVDPEEMLPVVNSPRMGVCGYTG
ncbi:MAG TPA: hypothetical protein VLU25_17945 [Acidobacteriota bacterium]|nr:hypothetical protein [Acidobacteriota bacterium]